MGVSPGRQGRGELLGEDATPPPATLAPACPRTHLCPFTLLQHSRPSMAQTVRTQPPMMPTAAGRGMTGLETLTRGSRKGKGRVEYSCPCPPAVTRQPLLDLKPAGGHGDNPPPEVPNSNPRPEMAAGGTTLHGDPEPPTGSSPCPWRLSVPQRVYSPPWHRQRKRRG